MTYNAPLKFNDKGYSQIMYSMDLKKRYRIIKNPSKWTQIYYLSFVDNSNIINIKLYPWDRKIDGLDY